MIELSNYDIAWCVRRLPESVKMLLKSRPEIMVAGGYIRACVAGEDVNDIDIMAPSKNIATVAARALSVACGNAEIHESPNAFTVKILPIPAQFVHRWTFATAQAAIDSFDFTIARAAFWWNGTDWKSCIDPAFYQDLAAKRLVYCSPVRFEEAGGSMLRVLKFYQRGYRIPLDSLGAVVARLVASVDPEKATTEFQVAKVITGLLREVDPSIDPNHTAHLPVQR